ncbi:hypothetical protein, partial [Brevundimonas sp.]|uniref:hypothetical protein n=1 Tax=Brevundimonas sp. TaxID=1871086 RepID=UPI002ABBB24D
MNSRKPGDHGIAIKGTETARDAQPHAARLPHQFQQFGDGQRSRQIAAAALLQFSQLLIGAQQAVVRIGEPAGAQQIVVPVNGVHDAALLA